MTRPSDAEVYAQEFVSRYGTGCASRLFDIAARLSLSVREVDAKTFDGALIRVAGTNRGRVPSEENAEDASEPANGYLWDLIQRKGLTFRNYGEFVIPNGVNPNATMPSGYRGVKPFLDRACTFAPAPISVRMTS